jgi:hypothetical protein
MLVWLLLAIATCFCEVELCLAIDRLHNKRDMKEQRREERFKFPTQKSESNKKRQQQQGKQQAEKREYV